LGATSKKLGEKKNNASFSHFLFCNKWVFGKTFTSEKNAEPKGHGQIKTGLVRWARELRPSLH
jgi:hypothetical protein